MKRSSTSREKDPMRARRSRLSDELTTGAAASMTSSSHPTSSTVGSTIVAVTADDPRASKETLSKACCDKPTPQKFKFQLSPSDYQRIGKSFKCTRCGKIYCHRRGIQNHVNKVHLKSPKCTLPCARCGKTFKKPSDSKSQKEKDHCIIYKEKSRKGYALSPSDFERVGDSYKCTRCEKLYKDIKAVRYHVMYVHLKLPRYPCPYCDQTFKVIGLFTKHKLDEHSIDHRIKCNACDATFNFSAQLMRHMHNFHMLGVRRNCPSADCGYFCFSEGRMKRHVVKHSTVKEHHCKYCKKSFLRKTTLTFHERIHTGDKRKVCNVCGQAFVQRASLTYHMAKHHPEVRF